MPTEFDLLSDDYRVLHRKNISISGESPEYFYEYKVADLAELMYLFKPRKLKILDFGCGVGNSLPYFRKYFPKSEIYCADISACSIAFAKKNFPGNENYLIIVNDIQLPSNFFDIVFSACVFHHIQHKEHMHWIKELYRVTKPCGLLAIYEHNPLNPLTVKAVNACALDKNAHLIHSHTMRKRAYSCGWIKTCVDYKLFFPSILSSLRSLEPFLNWFPMGAQYRISAQKPK